MENSMVEPYKKNLDLKPEEITPKDIRNSWMRWYFANEIPHAFDRYTAAALMWALMPVLKKIYKDKAELNAAYQRHLLFFNSNASWGGGTITGIMVSMEEERATQIYETGETQISDEAIYNIKAGLMGAMAGIGDSIDSFTIMYILISIGLPWAQAGSVWGALFPWVAFVAYQFFMGWNFTRMGYNLGTKAASELLSGQKSKSIIDGLSIVGLWMMGVLISNYVKISSGFKWTTVQGEQSLQALFDSILPGLLPFVAAAVVYYYYTRKEFNIMKAVIGVTLILGILAAIGIL
ncbi:PTS system mannose/fructose/sorbose family transporter subunit IID [Enterococcus sp. AZ163]|uniref:PTS system mannose/fructose/sorbose family transporter subunit IID n=1 Tax=Enterococcus sp. AZ163 TaxID=2774638 RepID=UPI003D2BA6B5